MIILLLVRRLFFFCRRAAVTEYIDLADENAPIHSDFAYPKSEQEDNKMEITIKRYSRKLTYEDAATLDDKLLSTCNRMAASSYVPPKYKK